MQQRIPPKHALAKEASKQAAKPRKATTLNAAQQAVKERIQGTTLVKAGPGTGKTQTLIHWITHCLEQTKAPPTQMLAITFTNRAADEMKARLTALLGDEASSIQVGTFHAIAYQLLQERHPELETVYDEESRKLALQLCFPALQEAPRNKLAKALARYFEIGECTGFDRLAEYAARYQDYLKQRQAIDLAAIIKQLLHLWEQEPAWLAQHRARYDYIAVDELQDINPLQYQLIYTLAQGKNILAIGDPDQAIYGFRGAAIKCFFRFQEDFQAQALSLEQNYRTTGTIVQATQALIQRNTLRSGLQLRANKRLGDKISVYKAEDGRKEATYVVDQVKAYVGGLDNLALGTHGEGSYTFADIAVLFRQRAVGKAIASHLKQTGIPAHFGDGTPFLASPPFCVIADILRLYTHPKDITALHGFLTNGLQWEKSTIQKLLAQMDATSPAFPQKAPPFLSAQEQSDYSTWLALYSLLPQVLRDSGVKGAIEAILAQYLPNSCLDDSQHLQKETILTLAQEARAAVPAFLAKMTLGAYTDAGRIKGEGIHLLTFHAAKGLEFPVVFIVGTEEGITPMQRADSDLEEERRLFYVALTRAKQEVHITYAQKRTQYGQEKEVQPSRFISELPQQFLKTIKPNPSPKQLQKRQLRLF